jgi:hypothetical protein
MADSETTKDVIAGWVGGAGKKMVCDYREIIKYLPFQSILHILIINCKLTSTFFLFFCLLFLWDFLWGKKWLHSRYRYF